MTHLILNPTELSQWHKLVNEAQAATSLILNENTESYLVFLLMRFCNGPELIESVLALDVLESRPKPAKLRIEVLKNVGDKSLLFCGLFPGIASKRRVNLSYFADLGQSAYLNAGLLQEDKLYLDLSNQFLRLKNILQAMRTECLAAQKARISIVSIPQPPLQ